MEGAIWGLLLLTAAFNLVAYLLLRFNKPRYQTLRPPKQQPQGAPAIAQVR